MLNNKKADLPIVLLVMLTIVLCMTSLIYFYFSGTRSTDTLSDDSRIVNMYSDYELFEEYTFMLSKNIALELNKEVKLDNANFKERFLKEFKFESEGYMVSLENAVFSVSKDSGNVIRVKIDNVKYFSYQRDRAFDINYIVYVKNLDFNI